MIGAHAPKKPAKRKPSTHKLVREAFDAWTQKPQNRHQVRNVHPFMPVPQRK